MWKHSTIGLWLIKYWKQILRINFIDIPIYLACCIRLRNLRYLRENNTQAYSNNPHRRNPNVSRRFRWFTQTNSKTTKPKPQTSNNHKTTITTPNCLSLRNNAALLHSSAWSAPSAGKYPHKSTQVICTKNPIKSPADLADLRRHPPKTPKQH